MSQSQKNIKKGGPKKKKPKILKKKKSSNKKSLQIPRGAQSWSRLKAALKSAPGQKLLDEVRTPKSDQLEKVNVKQRTLALVDAVKDHLEGNSSIGGKVKEKLLALEDTKIGEKLKDSKKGNGIISKIEKGVMGLPEKIIHTLRHPCSLKIPFIKIKFPHIPKLHQPKICGHKPTAIIKGLGHEIVDIGHSMVDGIEAVGKGAKHMGRKLIPSFTWPVDGKCPHRQRGGRRTRRRRLKKRHTHRRRKTRRRRTKKFHRNRRTRRHRTTRKRQQKRHTRHHRKHSRHTSRRKKKHHTRRR